jgi:hypothetical protein
LRGSRRVLGCEPELESEQGCEPELESEQGLELASRSGRPAACIR